MLNGGRSLRRTSLCMHAGCGTRHGAWRIHEHMPARRQRMDSGQAMVSHHEDEAEGVDGADKGVEDPGVP